MKTAPHPFTLRQLQYVAAVADEMSFRRAAERCHVSQPSLSAQLAQLEDALGVRFFERDRKRVLITQAGRELLARTRRLLVAADDLVDAARRAADPYGGTLRIGVIPTIAPYLLPTVAPKLRAKFSRLTFAWQEEKTADLLEALEHGEIDAALIATTDDVDDQWERQIIAKDAFVVATQPKHPLGRSRSPVENSELRGVEVLLLDDGHCFRDQALEVCSTARAKESEFRATSLTTLIQMVAGGAGVTLLPELSVATEAKRARLNIRPLASSKAHRTIVLAWRKNTPVDGALREIAEILRETFPKAR